MVQTGERKQFSLFDLDHGPTTLTYNPRLAKIKVDPHAKNQGQSLNGSNREVYSGAYSASPDSIAGLWGLKGKKGRGQMLGLSPTHGYASDLGYSSSSHLRNAIMDTDSWLLSTMVQYIEDRFPVVVRS